MRDDGSDKRQLTNGDVFDHAPHWSPDGDRIVFVRAAVGVFGDLYVVSTYTGFADLLMPLAGALAGPQFAPAWSPDGLLVAFASKHSGDYVQVCTVRSDGTLLTQRTFAAIDHANPAWIINAAD